MRVLLCIILISLEAHAAYDIEVRNHVTSGSLIVNVDSGYYSVDSGLPFHLSFTNTADITFTQISGTNTSQVLYSLPLGNDEYNLLFTAYNLTQLSPPTLGVSVKERDTPYTLFWYGFVTMIPIVAFGFLMRQFGDRRTIEKVLDD